MPFDGAGFAPVEYIQRIDAVIELLETPDKWVKGILQTHDGRYCLRGAIREVDESETLSPVILAAISPDTITGGSNVSTTILRRTTSKSSLC